jgi:hypothetical protein
MRAKLSALVICAIAVIFLFMFFLPGEKEKRSHFGQLIVRSGYPVRLPAGQKLEYETILIHKGAVLEFYGDTPAWTQIICYGNFRLEGTIRSKGFEVTGKSLDTIVYNGNRVGHDYDEPTAGGRGGNGGRLQECHQSSCLQLACFSGKRDSLGTGGLGSRGMSNQEAMACANPGKCEECYLCIDQKYKVQGHACDACDNPSNRGPSGGHSSPGKGAAGGSPGKVGGLLYIYVGGDFISHGVIDVSGSPGGRGSDADSNWYSGGGGGGGGAGGNGGAVYLEIIDKGNPSVNIEGGSGGKGGKGGTPHPENGFSVLKGEDGKPGSTGKRGKQIRITQKSPV